MDFASLNALAPLLPQEKGSFLRYATTDQRNEYFKRVTQYNDLVYSAIAAFTIICWETLLLAPAELRTIRLLLCGRLLPARLAVLVVRWSCIAAMICVGILMWGEPSNCNGLGRAVYAWYIPLWAAAASVSLMRLNILFQGDRIAMSAYGIIYLFCLGAWINLARGIVTHTLPVPFRLPKMPICFPDRIPSVSGPVAWGASFFFDFAVLAGTMLQLRRLSSSKGGQSQLARTRRWLWTSNMFYFSISAFLNLACMITEITVENPILSHIATPIAFSLHTVIASRLVLSAKGWSGGAMLDDPDDGARNNHFINTFNRDKRQTRSVLGGPIRFTVDETIVTSVIRDEEGAVQDADRQGHGGRSSSRRTTNQTDGLQLQPQHSYRDREHDRHPYRSNHRARTRAALASEPKSPISPLPSYRSMSEGEKSSQESHAAITAHSKHLQPRYSVLGGDEEAGYASGSRSRATSGLEPNDLDLDALHSDEQAERLVDDLAAFGFIDNFPCKSSNLRGGGRGGKGAQDHQGSRGGRRRSFELEDRRQCPATMDCSLTDPGHPHPPYASYHSTAQESHDTPSSSLNHTDPSNPSTMTRATAAAGVGVGVTMHPYATGTTRVGKSDDSLDQRTSTTTSNFGIAS